jgi:hypothetical protein
VRTASSVQLINDWIKDLEAELARYDHSGAAPSDKNDQPSASLAPSVANDTLQEALVFLPRLIGASVRLPSVLTNRPPVSVGYGRSMRHP